MKDGKGELGIFCDQGVFNNKKVKSEANTCKCCIDLVQTRKLSLADFTSFNFQGFIQEIETFEFSSQQR